MRKADYKSGGSASRIQNPRQQAGLWFSKDTILLVYIMRPILLLSISLVFLTVFRVFADAMPHFYQKPQIEFFDRQGRITHIDSLLILTNIIPDENRNYKTDSLYLSKNHTANSLSVAAKGTYEMFIREPIKTFKILIMHKGKIYCSDVIIWQEQATYYKFQLQKANELKDESPFFKARWDQYIKSLAITILLELSVAFAFRKHLSRNFTAFTGCWIILNLITHPLVWYLHLTTQIGLLLLEIIAWFFEFCFLFLIFKKIVQSKKVLQITVIANLVSWIIGGLLIFIL